MARKNERNILAPRTSTWALQMVLEHGLRLGHLVLQHRHRGHRALRRVADGVQVLQAVHEPALLHEDPVQRVARRRGAQAPGARLRQRLSPNPASRWGFPNFNPPTPLPARGRRWGSRLALERDCGSLLPSLSPSPVEQPSFFPVFLVLLRFFSFLFLSAAGALLWLVLAVDKRVRPGKAREAKLLWLAAPSGLIALLHIGLKVQARWTRSCSCCLRPGDFLLSI